jgi:hypothetical protein
MAKKRLSFLLVKDQKQRALGVGVSPLEPALRTEKIKLIEVDPRCRFHWKEFGSPGFSTRVLHSPPTSYSTPCQGVEVGGKPFADRSHIPI